MRKLVSVQKVSNLYPIAGADQIEMARVLGWELVVKKGEFKPGDLCVYGEIDSIFPSDNPNFAHLEGKHIKTIKLRGQISQGIAFSLSILPEGLYQEGDDVTEILGVTKYDPAPLDPSQNAAPFPGWIVKTDEERIQTCPELIDPEQIAENQLYMATEKLDGCSATYYLNLNSIDHPFGVCSRGQEIVNPDQSVYWRMASTLKVRQILENLASRHQVSQVVLQGEIIGEGVQKNKYKIKGLDFYAFNLLLNGQKHNALEINQLLADLNLKAVPVLSENFVLPSVIADLIKLAEGFSLLNPQTHREGLIIRSYNHRVSFKAINPQFLLKYDS